MEQHPNILDYDSDDAGEFPKKEIWRKWIRFAYGIFFFIALYIYGKVTGNFDTLIIEGGAIAYFLGTISQFFFLEKKTIYIYHYKFEKTFLTIFLVNFFGKKELKTFNVDEISKSKFREKNYFRDYDKMWIEIDEIVYEYYFIKKDIGAQLIEELRRLKL